MENNFPKRILLVEDEPAMQEAIKFKLEKDNIEVLTANNGEEALILLKEKESPPNLIWLDFLMPKMNALEFLKILRENDIFKSLPVVIVSASADSDKIKQAYALGISDYIVKSNDKFNSIIFRVESFLK